MSQVGGNIIIRYVYIFLYYAYKVCVIYEFYDISDVTQFRKIRKRDFNLVWI